MHISVARPTARTVRLVLLSIAALALLWGGFTLTRGPAMASEGRVETLSVQAETSAVNRVLSYQGRLLDPSTGAPKPDGNYAMTFRLYSVATAGSALWTESQTVTVADGVFHVLLGSVTALDLADFDGQDLYLGVTVGADPEASPRQRIAYSAYALRAVNADNASELSGNGPGFYRNASNLNAGTINNARIPAGITRDAEVVDLVLAGDGAGSGLDADLLDGQNSSDFAPSSHNHNAAYVNSVGIDSMTATDDDNPVLIVTQKGKDDGVLASTVSTTAGEAALHGVAGNPASNINSVAGVFGTSAEGMGVIGSSTNNSGVFGWSTNDIGVEGQTTGTGGVGVMGSSFTNAGNGVHGIAYVNSLSANGVYGDAKGASLGSGVRGQSNYVGMWGESTGAYGVYGFSRADNGNGVYAYATGTGGDGLYARGGSGTGAYAGNFNGNVAVSGSLSKGSGSFKIDHPLDPENKYLYHSFVESPDMMNVYNGNAVLDASGAATVQLPDYFEALNRDFRYQLTPIGGAAPNLHVAAKISGNVFSIAGGSPGLEVSWQVTGIRNDPFAQANPIVTEVEKPAEERGLFLHPDAYDQIQPDARGKRLGVDEVLHPAPSADAP